MPKNKNSRIDTYNKLLEAKITNTRDIKKMTLEDAEKIVDNVIFQNILYLRRCIKERKTLEYFNYDKTTAKNRVITFKKLIQLNKLEENEILNLQFEDLIDVINNEDFYNILLLRKLVNKGNTLDYFNNNIKFEREENDNE